MLDFEDKVNDVENRRKLKAFESFLKLRQPLNPKIKRNPKTNGKA